MKTVNVAFIWSLIAVWVGCGAVIFEQYIRFKTADPLNDTGVAIRLGFVLDEVPRIGFVASLTLVFIWSLTLLVTKRK